MEQRLGGWLSRQGGAMSDCIETFSNQGGFVPSHRSGTIHSSKVFIGKQKQPLFKLSSSLSVNGVYGSLDSWS